MEQNQIKKVILFGTFDLFHAGHEHMFKQARALGDYLIVVVGRDETVRKIKGAEPYYNERQRVKNLKNSGLVDKVMLGSLGDKHAIIGKIRPDVIALGYDQFAFTHQLEKFLIDEKINANIQRLQPYRPEIYKSSIIRASMLEKENREHGGLGFITANTNTPITSQLAQEVAYNPHT
jgi:cytidyltransferase-like protein